MIRLSVKQMVILDVIEKHVELHNYPPTVRELAAAVGLKSCSTAHGYLHRLKAHGLIEWEADRPRTLKVIKSKEADVVPAKYIGSVVQIVYQDKSGKFTQRRILVRSIEGGKVSAFDLEKHSPRVFEVDRILAVLPVGRSA